ncbi:lysM domain protein [Oceanicola granulosus HTCC2516]|uniref:LysM domain protein n=1 Tax=Oceanicola granulosus (strain ATCC BAA-861 / DSM 15982 / KCTC 12143 / HTCC2516) TaxID=314256 RepID=Q2CJ23_OCEGH|nr:LysM peptidoglycan-binding domain-containing protein [Oceanicola granulosus]EAR52777.1 lysM domain protein [Oceanicola granulosus HTCC2516]
MPITLWKILAGAAGGTVLVGAALYVAGPEGIAPRTVLEAPEGAAPESVASASAPAPAEAPVAEAVPAEEAAAAQPAAAPLPAFDVVRIEPDGSALVAGRALPREPVAVLVSGEPLHAAETDADGRFVAFLDLPPSDTPRTLALLADPEGTARRSEQTVIVSPFAPAGEDGGEVGADEPVAGLAGGDDPAGAVADDASAGENVVGSEAVASIVSGAGTEAAPPVVAMAGIALDEPANAPDPQPADAPSLQFDAAAPDQRLAEAEAAAGSSPAAEASPAGDAARGDVAREQGAGDVGSADLVADVPAVASEGPAGVPDIAGAGESAVAETAFGEGVTAPAGMEPELALGVAAEGAEDETDALQSGDRAASVEAPVGALEGEDALEVPSVAAADVLGQQAAAFALSEPAVEPTVSASPEGDAPENAPASAASLDAPTEDPAGDGAETAVDVAASISSEDNVGGQAEGPVAEAASVDPDAFAAAPAAPTEGQAGDGTASAVDVAAADLPDEVAGQQAVTSAEAASAEPLEVVPPSGPAPAAPTEGQAGDGTASSVDVNVADLPDEAAGQQTVDSAEAASAEPLEVVPPSGPAPDARTEEVAEDPGDSAESVDVDVEVAAAGPDDVVGQQAEGSAAEAAPAEAETFEAAPIVVSSLDAALDAPAQGADVALGAAEVEPGAGPEAADVLAGAGTVTEPAPGAAREPAPAPAGLVSPEPAPAPAPVAPVGRLPEAPSVIVADAEGVRVLQPATGGEMAPEVMANVAIDTITYDPEGEVVVGGRGGSDGFVRIYIDNSPVATSPIAADGQWRTDLPEVDTGTYTLRVDEVDAEGAVVSRVETPFRREAPETVAQVMAEETSRAGFSVAVKTVQPGHTLWAIAEERYGEGVRYVSVFEANRDLIRDPDLIYPGQVFRLPDEG